MNKRLILNIIALISLIIGVTTCIEHLMGVWLVGVGTGIFIVDLFGGLKEKD